MWFVMFIMYFMNLNNRNRPSSQYNWGVSIFLEQTQATQRGIYKCHRRTI